MQRYTEGDVNVAAVDAKIVAVARLLACYDPRLEVESIAERLNYTKDYVDSIISRMRNMDPHRVLPQHIRDVRPLGLKTLVVGAKPLPRLPETLEELARFVPAPRFFYSYRVMLDNVAVYSYVIPEELERSLVSEILEGFRDGYEWHDIGYTVPVRPPCRPDPGVDLYNLDRAVEALVDEYAGELEKSVERIEYGLAELMIYAILDANPLVSKKDILDPGPVLAERLEKEYRMLRLKKKKIFPRYQELSAEGIVGRVMLHGLIWSGEDLNPLFIRGPSICADRVYTALALLRASANVFIGSEYYATVATVPERLLGPLRRALGDCVKTAGPIASGVGTVIPVEMYKPKHGWVPEPQPLDELLIGLGLAEEK